MSEMFHWLRDGYTYILAEALRMNPQLVVFVEHPFDTFKVLRDPEVQQNEHAWDVFTAPRVLFLHSMKCILVRPTTTKLILQSNHNAALQLGVISRDDAIDGFLIMSALKRR